jgi:predicted Zn-ribbon and HTH transcriptional regulator
MFYTRCYVALIIMRTIVNYIRQIFCKHDWITEEKHVRDDMRGDGMKIYMRCKKCGYHTKHWKFI